MADDDALATGWGPHEPIDDSVLRRFVFNQVDALRAMVCGRDARQHVDDDVAMFDSGGPVLYDNMTVLLRPVLSVDDPVVDRIADFYADAQDRVAVVLSVWPAPDLSSRGIHLSGHPMFVVRPPGPVTAAPREGVSVREVASVDDLRVLERVAIDGFPIDPAQGSPPGTAFPDACLDALASTPLSLRLGAVEGAAVSGAAGYVAHGVTNLCFAATLPAGRRRGVWSALVWARVAEAPDQPAVAFTSDDSRPGFVQLGFLPVMRFSFLVRPAHRVAGRHACAATPGKLGAARPEGAVADATRDDRPRPDGCEPRASPDARRARVRGLRREQAADRRAGR
jgi:hypothetical protein